MSVFLKLASNKQVGRNCAPVRGVYATVLYTAQVPINEGLCYKK